MATKLPKAAEIEKKAAPKVAAKKLKRTISPTTADNSVKPARAPLPTFDAPADFKPHFLLVKVTTAKDGLLAGAIEATRFQGRFDREAPEEKQFDLRGFDMNTMIAIQSRLAAVTFKTTNDRKYSTSPKERAETAGAHRLPADTTFELLLRVGKRSADGSIAVGFKGMWQLLVSGKTGRSLLKDLEKTDPVYRMFRKSARLLPAAFTEVLLPPKRTRAKATK